MGEWSLAAALNQPTGLATKPIKNLNQALLDKYIERGYLPEDELAKYEKNAAKMRNAGRQDINVQNAQANPEYEAYKAEYDVPFMHGTERLDRVLSKEGLDPKRATSGPMLYGTDSPEIASSYAKNKQDTSMMDDEDWDYSKAFTVAPQQLGHRGTIPYTVEQSWNYLDPEVKRDILTKAPRVGYSDLDQWQGDFVLHPEGEGNAINQSHYDYLLKQSRGNPIKAMRDYWLDSGNLFNEEEKMSQLYRLAGYPHEISQEMAPWTKREGVLTGVSRIRNPLDTSNVDELREKVIPALKDAFKNDRSRKKDYGADSWDKNTRYTPKEWVNELENDLNKGENSYVWTSIPDKITSELKRLGYNGIYDTGGKSAGTDSHQVTIPFNPSQIRSKFAAFDPILKHSPNLLAGTALGSVLLHDDNQGYAEGGSVDKDSLQLNKPQRTPSHPDKSHIVKTMVDGKEKIIRFGEQGAETAGKPKEGESDRMTAKRESFKARHAKNIAKGPSSAAYWANKVKWAEGGEVDIRDDSIMSKLDELAGGGDYLADLEQLKEAYPNANKFMSALKDAAYRSVPTTEQMMDPEFILENAGFGGLSTKLLKPMKASEAYGRIEGRPLYVTQADRTKVGGKFLGGPGFSRLQLEDPEYAEALAAWAVQNPSIASTIINGSRQAGEHDPVFTTFIGAPDQHRSNQMVFDYIYNDFKKASKKSDLFTPEKLDLMNERLANYYKDKSTKENLFPENINILDKNLKNYANTFDKRAAIAEVIGGKGIGGKKGQIIDYDKLLRSTSDPSFLDVPSGSLGNRLFTLNGEFLENRHDLHPAFPTILQGEDLGLVYQPVPRELVMKDFHNKIRQEKGREPGYFDWALGYPPSQLITEDLLTEMQRAGYAKGGEVSMDDLPFNDLDQLRLYHQAMKHYDDVIENTGASKKTGKGTARVNYSTLTKGDIDKENALHTLMANYGVDIGDLNLDAGLIKPMEADGLYIGDLTGSLPLGEGRASLGVQGMHSKYDDGLSGYTAGYNGKVGDGNLSARYFEPADHNSAGRQVQLEYALPFAKGGEVKDLHSKYEESDYGYGNRPDKTKKGLGYFGELERPDGTGVMTEYSIGVPIHGEEMDVPTLVPTLTPDEIRLILHMQDGDDMPRSIVHKAIDHAHQRLSEGKPIFATEEDLYAHGGIVDVLHNDAIEQIMKAFMDSMADDEELSAPAVSIEITTQNTETPQRGKIPKSIAREAKHG
jgi:hypothetical protein